MIPLLARLFPEANHLLWSEGNLHQLPTLLPDLIQQPLDGLGERVGASIEVTGALVVAEEYRRHLLHRFSQQA
jgi:hypothetical protein